MDNPYLPILESAAPDDILAVFRDQHRQQCMFDPEADATVILNRETTISEWRWACDLLGWSRLGEGLNEYWSVSIAPWQWREVLEPPMSRTLGEVCDLLARYARLPRVRPARIFGAECLNAGVFLTIRSFLAAAGADASEIAPSTPLESYTRRYTHVFLGPVSQLAPGTLPAVKIHQPMYHRCLIAFVLSWVAMLAGGCGDLPQMTVFSVIVALFAYLGIWIAARHLRPNSVEFPGLVTFRDLSRAVAEGVRT